MIFLLIAIFAVVLSVSAYFLGLYIGSKQGYECAMKSIERRDADGE